MMFFDGADHGLARRIARPLVLTGLLLSLGAPTLALGEDGAATVRTADAVVPAAAGQIDVRFEGLRSSRGMLRACLTKDRSHFPKCEKDPLALTASVAAGDHAELLFARVPPGDYALLVFHDENSNSRLDTMLGIPREGVGFSRNPRLRFGAPGFESVVLTITPGAAKQTAVKLQYFL
ncbi:uncharacterized protein (DUF2141 family) [Sphingobium sp. B2D3A]|uniref:DUF2141 domain-containing protein n=1 Tax=unclassified Sphingobium TaxID=2611147 RepID=UPI0022242B8A|nr:MULTISPECIES: DUF2141 domain-containing protein [unclassified Sphingobium]MCW2337159.1 uncharacterized protein (DUF2141 family) [Sphingobium sp. B2D3A]MCW2383617.1 uncharacterized protein (DUF2141 family) [Sphingobium sp. B2D3D]